MKIIVMYTFVYLYEIIKIFKNVSRFLPKRGNQHSEWGLTSLLKFGMTQYVQH